MIIKIVLGIVLVPVILLNVFAPLLIKKQQKLPARVKFEEHDEKQFLLSRSDEFNMLNMDIRSLGFAYIGSSFMEDSHTRTNFSLYSNDDDLTCAMVVNIESNVKEITYIEFSQIYADGSMLDVTNAGEVPVFPKMDIKITARFPDVHSPIELYGKFRRLRTSLKNSEQPIAYNKSSRFEVVEDFLKKESDVLVDKGYCYNEVDAEGKRKLTFKGAYLITWRIVFPGKNIQALLDKQYSNRLLRNA